MHQKKLALLHEFDNNVAVVASMTGVVQFQTK